MAQGFGTAPRRVSPGVWKTAKGATLTAAQSAVWEHYFRTGHTDGRGHFTKNPSVVFNTAPPPIYSGQATKASPRAQRPNTTQSAGGRFMLPGQVQPHQPTAAEKRQQRIYSASKRVTAEQAAQYQRMLDQGLFGAAAPAVHSAYTYASPAAMAALNMLPNVAQAVQGGAVHPFGIGLDVAGLLPFGRGVRLGKEAVDAVEAARTAEHALTPEEKVVGALKGAKQRYEEQASLRSQELGRRVKSAGHAMELEEGGKAGVQAALGELKGKLPNLKWDALTHLTEPEVEHLIKSVDAHPDLQFFENLNAKLALWHAAEGKVITPSEQDAIERVFGANVAGQVAKAPSLGQNALRLGGEILNIPRSILSSFDVSGVLRQGLVASIHHPVLAAKNLGPMFRMLFDEKYFQDVMHGIEERPNFHLYGPSGLSLTELGGMGKREEAYMSNLAEKIPALGRVVRGSGRGYTGFLNLMRADIFDTFLDGAVAAGRPNTPELRRQIARQVNVWTGRGGLGKHGEKVAVPLNTVFFSPRLFSSRVQTFTTPFYKDLDPYVRKQAAYAATKLVAAGSTVLLLAWLAGAKVGIDPRNADFGKIRIGNTRFDIWGGHQQIARLIAQISSGTIISSTTGKTLRVGRQFGDLNRPGIAWRFVRGKFSPGTSLVYDWFAGSDYQGKPFSWKREALQHSFPLILQDVYDVTHQSGDPWYAVRPGRVAPALGTFGIGSTGIGVQTYGSKTPKVRGGGNDPYAGLYSGGSSDPYAGLYNTP